jgi:hypothetical protein
VNIPVSIALRRTIKFLKCLASAVILFLAFPAAGRCQASNNQQDSQSGNIKGQIVVNSAGGYPSIQEAIDLASTQGGGVVLVPSGRYVLRQIILRAGVSIRGLGINPAPYGEGTTLEQAPGVNMDFIVGDTRFGPTDTQHWSVISNIRLKGNEAGNTRGSGIHFVSRTGEGTKLEHLSISGFPESGVSISRGAVPFYADDIHLFHNGQYGIDISRTSHDLSPLVRLTMISGDDNGTALIHIGPSGGLLGGEAYLIEGVKAEKHTPGKQNDVILLDHMNGSPVVILGAGATNTSGEQADAIVRVEGSSTRLFYFGLSHDKNWAYTVNDTVFHRTLPNSAAGIYGADIFPPAGTEQPTSPANETGVRHGRNPACSTGGNDSCDTHVSWDQSFADTNYTATCSLEGASGRTRGVRISNKSLDSLTVTIQGESGASRDETLNCIAIHD